MGIGPFKKGAVNGASTCLPVEESNLTLLTGILLSSIYIYIDTFIRMDGCGSQPQVVRLAAAGYWLLIL
jgi:hypothetical protein